MLPGDTFKLSMHAFARMNTPLFPIMDNLYLESFFFAVPNRLLWSNWEKFCGAQDNPGDSTSYTIPYTVAPAVTGVQTGELCDYFGIPIGIPNLQFNSLPLRAYNLIWNEWFRSEVLQNSVAKNLGNGPDSYSDYTLLRRGKRHDYFTSCLPWPCKPVDTNIFDAGTVATIKGNSNPTYVKVGAGTDQALQTAATSNVLFQSGAALGAGGNTLFSTDPSKVGLVAVLDTAAVGTINDLRLAFQTQRYFEKNARAGTRYTEILKSHFIVDSPDARLQRPEYLGGSTTPVIVNPVAQTSATSGTNALGDLAAYGVCAPMNHGFTYSAVEHMTVIGLVMVRADLNYQYGLDRGLWSRRTLFDYYWPTLAHLGEQSVLNKEIYVQGTSDDDLVFGYQERYAEYRYKPSLVTGVFRSQATGTFDSWHLAQSFGSLPLLNSTFIQENPPMSRIMAVSSELGTNVPDFIFDAFFKYHCVRPMPVRAVPGMADHF